MAGQILSEPRSAQAAKAWLPNRMFDADANTFAIQNLLKKDQEKFTPESDRRLRSGFVADRLGREDDALASQAFVAEGSENSQQFNADEAVNAPVTQAVSETTDQTESEPVVAQASEVSQQDIESAADMQPIPQPDIDALAAAVQAAALSAAPAVAEAAAADPMPASAAQLQAEPVVPPPVENAAPVAASAAGLSVVAITNMINAAREEAHNAAYKDGFFAGHTKAKSELQQEYDHKFAALKSLSDGVQELSNNADALFEPLKKLAVHLAEQLVRGELTQSGQAISRLVENALQEMGGSGEKTMIVHLNTEDLELFRPLAEQFGESITLRPNSTLKRGSVRVSLDGSIVEDLIERRLEGLNKSLVQPSPASWRNGQSTSLAARIEAAKRAGQVVEDVSPVQAEDVTLAAADEQPGQDHA